LSANPAAASPATARPAVSPGRAWWSIFVFSVTLMFLFLDRQVMTLLVTPIKRDLGLSDTQISVLIGFMFVLFYVGAGIPISRLVDRGPRKWIIGIGITFWSLMTAACGLAQNFWQLAFARMAVGVGESCNAPATYSMTADMFPRAKLARAISAINLGQVAGQGMALLIGGTIVVWLTSMDAVDLPLVGRLHAWQLTFIIVGLPGILWALVLLATVPEPPRRGEAGDSAAIPSIGEVVRFLGRWWTVYVPILLAAGIKAMLSFGTTVWSPTFFERKFGWAPGEPGLYIGAVTLLITPIGLLIGGWLADRRSAQGHDDANMRIVFWASIGLLPFAILYPLMPTPELALALLGCSLFLGGMGTGPANAAVQTITPGRMRGTITALYIAVFNVLGYGVGPFLVAQLTDRLFADEAMLPASMATAAAVLAPLGLLISWLVLRPYARAAMAARDREA
jgi:MFS family permease